MGQYIFTCILYIAIHSIKPDPRQVLKLMYDRYNGKWFHTLTFTQRTETYRNDSLIKTATWYEYIMFPDKFRIDFGDPSEGNAVIFGNDSAYNFQKGKLKASRADNDDLTFLLGGLYFYPFEQVLAKLKSFHYDLNKFHEDVWSGKPVYVIGADTKDEKLNQLWIDKEKMVLVRFIKFDENQKEEGVFEKHIPLSGGWSETMCTFYINDHLIQKEYYRDCKADGMIDPMIFEPAVFGR